MSSGRPREVSFPNRIRVRLSRRDRDLILKHTFIGGDVEARICVARANGTAIMVDLTPDDIDELLGYVAAAANHSEQPVIRRQLYALYDRLAAVEATQARRSEAAGASASGSGRLRSHRFTRRQGQAPLPPRTAVDTADGPSFIPGNRHMGPYLRKGGTFLTGFHSLVIPGVQSVEGVGETAVPGHLLLVGCEAGLGIDLVGRGRAVILAVGLLDH